MAYIQPQLKIHQEFTTALAAGAAPLYACVVGPTYGLHRYSVSSEKALLGSYDPSSALSGAYPDKQAGSSVDLDTVGVWIEDARLQYYTGTDFSVPQGAAAGGNRLKATFNLKTANGYSRDDQLGTRDVALGDSVEVTWVEGSNTGTRVTKVMGFASEVEAAVESVVAGNNKAAVASGSIAVDSGTIDSGADLTPSILAGSSYAGLADGLPSETYTVRVTKSGASGVAEAMILSDSGTDDVLNKVVNFASTDIGTRGVKLKLTEGTGTGLLTVGEEIVISASQTYAPPSLTNNNVYTGPADTTYIVQITRGGVVGSGTAPMYKVTTSNGVDAQSATAISAAGSIQIGNYGVALTVASGDKFCTGDTWTVKANADTQGAVKTVVLADKLISESDSSVKCSTASTVTVRLGLPATVKLPVTSYTLGASSLTVPADLSFSADHLGSEALFPVRSGSVYVDYREFLPTAANEVLSAGTVGEVSSLLGPAVAGNPLALAVSLALSNSGGTPVYFVPVASDDVEGYTAAVEATTNTQEVFSIVPLSKDGAVQSMVASHVASQSGADKNNWRVCWLNSKVDDDLAVYTLTSDSLDILAVIGDDAGGTDYVNLVSSNGKFVSNGVAAGDVVRYNYQPGVTGGVVYDEALVAEVVSDDELLLASAATSAFSTGVKIEIWRSRSKNDMAEAVASESSSFGSRRVRNIWPDVVPLVDGTVVSGVFLCAALAGLRSGAAPHAPLTNVAVAGFQPPARSNMFSASQLNTIASGGTWVVVSDSAGGVYTRHQLTTDMSDVNMREDTVTCNLDSIARWYRSAFADLIGRGNVSAEMLIVIEMRIRASSGSLMAIPYPSSLGPQMQGYTLSELSIDSAVRDQVRVRVTPVMPYPLNNLDVYITI